MVDCPHCHAAVPEVAHFCPQCGRDLRSADGERRTSFALNPDEPVASFALVSTIMPRAAMQHTRTYRLMLDITLVAMVFTAILGWVPAAVMIAAFAIPVVYIAYLYDVNLWEDNPLLVTAAAFLLTGALAVVWTLLWQRLLPVQTLIGFDQGSATPTLAGFVVAGLLAPVIGELIRQAGPILLASRPQFDDLMDGFTFGVISGVAYATADTLVRHWDLLVGGFSASGGAGTWIAVLVLEGFVKPLVLGSATGLAAAEFSGLGAGYDGFTPRYFRALGITLLAVVAYFGGAYLLSFIPSLTGGLVATIGWGLLILGALLLRVRTVLHNGLMEAALESSARASGVGPDGDLAFCPRCEMPLIEHSAFCAACGTSLSVAGHIVTRSEEASA